MGRNLLFPLQVLFLIVFGIESIVSLLANGFILAVNIHSWFRSKMLPCDVLLTTLSLSRCLSQLVSMISQYMYSSSPYMCMNSKEQILILSWMYLTVASLWCATWLNIFYCMKVTNFTHPLFSWLKLRIGVLVPRFLGGSLLIFTVCSIHPVTRYFEDGKCPNLTGNRTETSSQRQIHRGSNFTKFLGTLQIYFTALSFSICLVASLVLLLSLWRHTRNLKKGGFNTKDLSTQAHLSVMKTLLLNLFFYILHFAAIIIAITNDFKYDRFQWLISDIFQFSYPLAHSVILIFTNPKLRKVCIHLLNLRRSPS